MGNRLPVEAAADYASRAEDDQNAWAGGTVVVEAWGWQGGALRYLGEAQQTFAPTYPTSLEVCVSSCGADRTTFPRKKESNRLWNSLAMHPRLDFEWITESPFVDRIVWQVSRHPFPPGPLLVESAFTQEQEVSGSKGVFIINFDPGIAAAAAGPGGLPTPTGQSAPFSADPLSQAPGNLFGSLKIWLGDYYVRAIHYSGSQPAGEPSNPVVIHITLQPEDPGITVFQVEPLYTVRIVEFKPVTYGDPSICNGALVLEEDWIFSTRDEAQGMVPATSSEAVSELAVKLCASRNGVYDPGTGVCTVPAGTRFCSESYRGMGEQSWYEALFDFMKGGVSWVSNLYESIKQGVVSAVGSVMCGSDPTCEDFLMAGLNIGLAAMGIPPSIPNFDQLLNQGIDYLAAEVVDQISGTEAATAMLEAYKAQGGPEELANWASEEFQAWAAEQIKAGIQSTLDSGATNSGCRSEEEAHAMGVEPLCLPVKTRLDPDAGHRPASLSVEVTRRLPEELPPNTMLTDQWLYITFNVRSNAYPIGHVIDIDGTPVYDKGSIRISEPLSGEIFNRLRIHLPRLAPGESVSLTLVPEPADYWIPERKEKLAGVTYMSCYDQIYCTFTENDWFELYFGADIEIVATVHPSVDQSGPQTSGFIQAQCLAGPIRSMHDPYISYCGP